MAGTGILMQWMFLFIGLLSVSSVGSIWAWQQAIWALVVGLILVVLLLFLSLLFRSAYHAHIIFSLLVVVSIIPLLGIGFALPSGGTFQILFIIVLCGFNWALSYKHTYGKLRAANNWRISIGSSSYHVGNCCRWARRCWSGE